MSDAERIQADLVGFLVRRRDLTTDEEARRFAGEHIAGNDRVSPVEALEIYREQYWLRHTSSLVEDFPGVGGVLGQAEWERLVEEYLVAHPPASFSLRDLGEKLPDFAATRDWLPHRDLVVDMARLEWAHADVFDAPAAGPLAPEKLRAVPEDGWEGVRLVTHPALRLLEVTYPVVELWQRLRASQSDESPGAEPIALPEPEPVKLAVHRRQLEIVHDRLEPDAFTLLSKLVASTPLGLACQSTADELGLAPDEIGQRLESWFATWTARGYLVDLVIPD